MAELSALLTAILFYICYLCFPQPHNLFGSGVVPFNEPCETGSLQVHSIFDGGVTNEMAAKPATTAQDYISTFATMKPLDIFKDTSQQFSASLGRRNQVLFTRPQDISSQKHGCSFSVVSVPKQIIRTSASTR